MQEALPCGILHLKEMRVTAGPPGDAILHSVTSIFLLKCLNPISA